MCASAAVLMVEYQVFAALSLGAHKRLHAWLIGVAKLAVVAGSVVLLYRAWVGGDDYVARHGAGPWLLVRVLPPVAALWVLARVQDVWGSVQKWREARARRGAV
jgi:hypothetical protein